MQLPSPPLSWSEAPWRKWLLLQHPVSSSALWVSAPLPLPWLPLWGVHLKTMASAGKMKCQAPNMTRKFPDPGPEMHFG